MEHAKLKWQENGTPIAIGFDDIYFSTQNGFAEATHVFLEGNNLPKRWQEENLSQPFTIAELGFGTGLNFLAAWQAWAKTSQTTALNFISVEKFPLTQEDLKKVLDYFPATLPQAQNLLDNYPTLHPGWNKWSWPQNNVNLHLFIGDVEDFFKTQFNAHAWFLDGFNPKENPQMWSKEVCQNVASRTHLGGTFATFSVARMVRENLAETPFVLQRSKGFGKKREMLTGKLREKT